MPHMDHAPRRARDHGHAPFRDPSHAPRAAGAVARRAMITLLTITATGLTGCTRIDNALASVPFFAFMRESPSFDPYEAPRPPPPGAVAFESPTTTPHPPIEASPAALVAFGEGPFGVSPLDESDPQVLALGQAMYERHCLVCHGVAGAGDGPAVGPEKIQFVLPINSPNAIGLSDGYIYALITVGRTLMPAYGGRTTFEERWAIVTYVRQLQAAVAPPGGAAQPGGAGAGQAGGGPRE